MVNNPRTTCKINTAEKWNFHIVEDNKKKEMIAADKSNSLYITNKIKKQAFTSLQASILINLSRRKQPTISLECRQLYISNIYAVHN